MALALGAILLGFIGLMWSADRFIAGAAATAKNMGMSPILIGLTIVSLGTSAPEIMVSAEAAIQGSGAIAVGNAIGSNLANIGLVLGITALLYPIPIANSVLQREFPLVLIATFSCILLFLDNHISRLDAGILLAALIFIMMLFVRNKSHEPNVEHDPSVEAVHSMRPAQAWFWLLFGLVVLVLSADVLVWGAKEAAIKLGVDELIIGLTVIAVGTSLPELVTTLMCAKKGHHEIALGNILGSNLFNLLGVIPVAALISPLALQDEVVQRDYSAMAAVTLILAGIVYIKSLTRYNQDDLTRLGRIGGTLLLCSYGAYYYLLFPLH